MGLEQAASISTANSTRGLALAILAHALEIDPGATELIFALARCGGWIAHALASTPRRRCGCARKAATPVRESRRRAGRRILEQSTGTGPVNRSKF
jgi:hypothetical protein